MADESAVTVYGNTAISDPNKKSKNGFSVKVGLAQMLRGGAIVQVTNVDEAKIAESAGACCVIVSEPSQSGSGISRMLDPAVIKEIQQSVAVPVMAKARVGHFVEAQILEAIGVDYIDENEVIAVADEDNFINKHNFRIPFICGCGDLGEGLRRVREGAAMIRTQGDLSGSGNIVDTVRNVREVMGKIRVLTNMDEDEVFTFAKELRAPYDILAQTKQMGRLPVVHFASGGIVTPADAALMMQLGCDGVFVGSEVFNSADPYKRVRGIVQAVRNYNDAHMLAKASSGLNDAIITSSSELNDAITGLNLDENNGGNY
ncbi:pyridoxal 5'-phosphate synthase-like subunit PDX1.2 [Cynara cardunculus var. scolymus]|uniref:Aldolase-type TIM barrel n=1 Tax=Cynara cardunculus var. scolymus TaxID=59895 RepID=A0A103XLW7_CYNCS|nr:pyridoxal 5'-phosphate synthase-like subunit PDX1.2 [Cynara cardunculus var. scolymus]KVH92969.1 Aldolase-type TIM barrel [Cynara cardunculus var. scolymus]